MLDEEGMKEILSVFTYLRNNGIKKDDKGGITQTIGYKEFEELYRSVEKDIPEDVKLYEEIYEKISESYQEIEASIDKKVLNRCQSILTKNTVDYAKRQITWIKNRIFQ